MIIVVHWQRCKVRGSVTLQEHQSFHLVCEIALLFLIFLCLEARMKTKLGPKYSEKIAAHFALQFIFAETGL